MREIINRQTVNISGNLNVVNGNNINVPISLRFPPDEVIVRQICYDTGAGTNALLQIYSNLIDDQILCGLADIFTNSTSENHFMLTNKPQYGVYNFQVQNLPANGFTGCGTLATIGAGAANGQYCIMLEFLKYDKK